MNVVQLGKYYWPYRGGIETVLRDLCDGLTRRGVHVTCLVAHDRPATAHDRVGDVDVVRAACHGTLRSVAISPRYVVECRRLVARADLVHLHQQNPLADVALLLARPRVPLVVSVHSAIVRQRLGARVWAPVLRALWGRAAAVVVASPPMRAALGPAACPHRPMDVVPYGIRDPLRLPGVEEASPRIVLGVGRLVSYKGFDRLIAAMARVPHARLVLVGEGPLRTHLEERARSAGVAARVRFEGAASNERLAELYTRCAVCVLPSVTPAEAFGMTQVEAMAYGKPVVSTSLPTGVPWVNQDGESGLVVPPGDTAALAAALERLLGDERLRRRLGAGARRRFEQHFTADRMVDGYLALYRRALDGSRPPPP